jgi:Tfp pilus assembly protein PilV
MKLHFDSLAHSAFSLVEVSLALLVVAVGILSVLSLFPAGLDQGARSADETHASQFAEEVFGGLRIWAETDFDSLANYSVPGAADNMWEGSREEIAFTGTNAATNVYEFNNIVDHSFRYRLSITNVNEDRSIMSASLYVYPGRFGALSNAIFFYTEFYDFNR